MQICGNCGGEMVLNGARLDCSVCPNQVHGFVTPPVEDLKNLCPVCAHAVEPEHDDFGCHIDGCSCSATNAGVVHEIAEHMNADGEKCSSCGHESADTLELLKTKLAPNGALYCRDCASSAAEAKAILPNSKPGDYECKCGHALHEHQRGDEACTLCKCIGFIQEEKTNAAGRINESEYQKRLDKAHKYILGLADAYSAEDAAKSAVYEFGISIDEANTIARDLIKRGYEFTNANSTAASRMWDMLSADEICELVPRLSDMAACEINGSDKMKGWSYQSAQVQKLWQEAYDDAHGHENVNALTICRACLAATPNPDGKETIKKGDVAHIVTREDAGHVEVACGDDVCPCENSGEHKNGLDGTTCPVCKKPYVAEDPKARCSCPDVDKSEHRNRWTPEFLKRNPDYLKRIEPKLKAKWDGASDAQRKKWSDATGSGIESEAWDTIMSQGGSTAEVLMEQMAGLVGERINASDRCPGCGHGTFEHQGDGRKWKCWDCDALGKKCDYYDTHENAAPARAAYEAHLDACAACRAALDATRLCADGAQSYDAMEKEHMGLENASIPTPSQEDAQRRGKTYVFRDSSGETMRYQATCESDAWAAMQEEYATTVSAMQAMGINLVQTIQNAGDPLLKKNQAKHKAELASWRKTIEYAEAAASRSSDPSGFAISIETARKTIADLEAKIAAADSSMGENKNAVLIGDYKGWKIEQTGANQVWATKGGQDIMVPGATNVDIEALKAKIDAIPENKNAESAPRAWTDASREQRINMLRLAGLDQKAELEFKTWGGLAADMQEKLKVALERTNASAIWHKNHGGQPLCGKTVQDGALLATRDEDMNCPDCAKKAGLANGTDPIVCPECESINTHSSTCSKYRYRDGETNADIAKAKLDGEKTNASPSGYTGLCKCGHGEGVHELDGKCAAEVGISPCPCKKFSYENKNALSAEQMVLLDKMAVQLYGKKYRDLDRDLEAQDDLLRRVTGEYEGPIRTLGNSGNCQACEKAAGKPLDQVEGAQVFTKDHRVHLIRSITHTSNSAVLKAPCGAELVNPDQRENVNSYASTFSKEAIGASRYGSGR